MMFSKQWLISIAVTLLASVLTTQASECSGCENAQKMHPILVCVKSTKGGWNLKAVPRAKANDMIRAGDAAYPGTYPLTEFCQEEKQLRGQGRRRKLAETCERSGDGFVPTTTAATFLAPKKAQEEEVTTNENLSNGFAENTCDATQWVPLDNSDSPTGMVRCCAGQHGFKGNDWGKCDTSSCPNNFNAENRNCENYGAPSTGNSANNNGGSALCPYLESDKAICDTSFYDDMNPVNCRTNPAGKNFQVHCLGKVKCNTVGVTIPPNTHSDGTAAHDDSGETECLGAQFGFQAGADCFYDGFSENWKVCDGDITPAPTAPEATPAPTGQPTASPTFSPTFSPTNAPSDQPTASPTKEVFNVGDTVEIGGTSCILQGDCSCEDPDDVAEDKLDEETPSGAKGDPHFIMFNGRHFEFQGGCDLVLADVPEYNNGQGLKIHIRTKIDTWFSYIERVAVQIGDDVLEVKGGFSNAKRRFWHNGLMLPSEELTKEDGPFPIKVGGNEVHFETQREGISWKVSIFLPEGQKLALRTVKDYMRVDFDEPKKDYFGSARGMMGSFEGNDEMMSRDGNIVMEDANEFGLEWQVRDTEPMLFEKAAGAQYPQQCQMPSSWWKHPESIKRRLVGSAVTHDDAERACAHLHPSERDDCVFDVIATNDVEIAAGY